MSTRRAAEGAALHHNRYMSDPEFVEMRGISGTAVATKAAYLTDPEQRALLFLILSLSIEQQGTKRLANELIEMFADRIGTPAMFRFGVKPGQIYKARQVKIVRHEVERGVTFSDSETLQAIGEEYPSRIDAPEENPRDYKGQFPLKGEYEIARTGGIDLLDFEAVAEAARDDAEENRRRQADAAKHPESYPASLFVDHCRRHVAERLPEFLVELCINPRMEMRAEDAPVNVSRSDICEGLPEVRPDEFRPASMRYFPGVLDALFEYKRRYEERARQAFAMTSIGKEVFAALDYSAKTRRMVLVEGHSGVGKTESVRAWWTLNRGRALYVQLTGINRSRAFFGAIAKAAGLPCTASLSPEKMQFRVERFLESSRLLLLIDEGQYLWPQSSRVTSHPELVNWINTACANKCVPVAIVATEDFSARRRAVEEQTNWNSFQLRRRIRRVFPLPAVPTTNDLTIVARKILPYGTDAMINFIVGYALTCSGYMQAVVDTIDDARLLAEDAGRDRITVADIKLAITEIRAPSDAAQKRVFAPAEKRGRKPRLGSAAAPEPQPDSADAADLPPPRRSIPADDFLSDESAPTNRLSGHELAET